MTKQLTPTRPALAAIAAVLAFGSTPAFAQEAQPQMTAPPAVTPPAPLMQPSAPTPPAVAPATPEAAAPVVAQTPPAQAPAAPAAPAQAPVFKAQAPVVQPTPPRPVIAAPAETDTAPVAEEAAPKPVRERAAARTAKPEATANPVPANNVAERTPIEAAPAPVVTPTSTADTVPTPAPVAEAPAPAPVQTVDNGMSDEAKFAMGAGAVAILAAGAAFAMRRRKDPANEDVAPVAYEPVSAPVAPVLSEEPAVQVRPARQPAMATTAADAPYVQPAYSDERVQPVSSVAPATSLEAMMAEQPTAANPFLTRRNRLRRANFLLSQQETGNRVEPRRKEPVAARQGQTVTKEVRSQPVYDFGKVSTGWRRLTPAST